jgi:excisionase family DNA binding protein
MQRTRTVTTDTYFYTAEVAQLLRVSPKTVTRWAKEGKLPFLRTIGGHRRYPEPEIRALIAALTEPVVPLHGDAGAD